jgi:excinuclease ABC subunit A
MHVWVLLSRYRAYATCPDCNGARLKPEALQYLLQIGQPGNGPATPDRITLPDFYAMPVDRALVVIYAMTTPSAAGNPQSAITVSLSEVRSRLHYLQEVGLGYLTLDRATRTLSGGETERVNLTTCLGTRLVNTLFVLDEPSVGLHPRDTERLVRILQKLRDAGNTVIVVEHEAAVMHAADQIVDLGPGHGESGGQVVFQGSFTELLQSTRSLTGQYLGGSRRIAIPERRPVQGTPRLRIAHATRHNLRDFAVDIPLNRLVCVTGVSGSGKTTLIRDLLFPALQEHLEDHADTIKASDRMETEDREDETEPVAHGAVVQIPGDWEIRHVVMVDQSSLGKTPRSNPAVYIGAFEDMREFFAQSDAARQRGLNASAFSFNSGQGQCERCRGAGFEKIEMQFLSDVYIRCPDCNGRRYRAHILEVKIKASPNVDCPLPVEESRSSQSAIRNPQSAIECSIADLLDATVDEAVRFLGAFVESRPAQRAAGRLRLLQELGLGYLRLGQPINTLSGGESQRLKLAAHLAETAAAPGSSARAPATVDPTLFIFDEPTTGLHFEDIRVLMEAFQRLVDAGHSLLIVEHNLEVIKCADWVIDLGPEAGEGGGQLVAEGTPEDIMNCAASHTGRFLKEMLLDGGSR